MPRAGPNLGGMVTRMFRDGDTHGGGDPGTHLERPGRQERSTPRLAPQFLSKLDLLAMASNLG